MRTAWAVFGIVLLVSSNLFAAQAPETPETRSKQQAEVSFAFEHEGLPVPRFTLRVLEDGTGTYQADQVAQSPGNTSGRSEPAQHIDRTMTLRPSTVARIFDTARSMQRFTVPCASRAKNIADTGMKTLRYAGPDGSGSCVYNYTENKGAVMLTALFLGIANTMDEGRRLEFLHRYDRLGLDAEIKFLSQEAAGGDALELETIAPALSAIASDTEIIERVRVRAARLLEQPQEGR